MKRNIYNMKYFISPSKHKLIVVLIAAGISLLGLEVVSFTLGIHQVFLALKISFYVYLALVFLQTFVFDMHLKPSSTLKRAERIFFSALKERFQYLKIKHHWLHFQNYLILPGFIYWTTVSLLYLNAFDQVIKQALIFLSTITLAICFWYLKTVFLRHEEARRSTRQCIFVTKLYASYLAFASAFGIMRYFDFQGTNIYWFIATVFCVTFLLFYQALFQHHFIGFKSLKFLLTASIFLAVVGYVVYRLWNVNFYSGALVLTAIYNTIWGIIHHQYIDKNLTREMVYEYLAVLFVILVIVFGTTNFAERI